MRKLTIFLGLIIVTTLSYLFNSFEFILIVVILVIAIFLILLRLLQLFKKIKPYYFRNSLLLMLICISGVCISLIRPYDKAVIHQGSLSEKLKFAYESDQKDRMQLRSFLSYFSKLEQRDLKRLNQVKNIRKINTIKKPRDKFYAAFIYHHGKDSIDYKTASKLATEAALHSSLKNDYKVQWLRKAACDRYLLAIGKQEKYNTQNNFSFDIE
ncbi:hypothetical protein GUB10_06420 [Salegentibacter sp. BLCTC]|uniref:hypothetical protein n=1 Tax=Salegentibacter sp. BLCTC TaxID=2697368 RepID=UPI00187B10AF|nr:hypothetical protein [Salegentibacter sp. BLCTC]MBE7639961.1 hypothetical protein [Salegentibacter sp. BLCTC]